MIRFLSTIGLCSIVIIIFYIIKKCDDYLFFKREEYKRTNLDNQSNQNFNDDLSDASRRYALDNEFNTASAESESCSHYNIKTKGKQNDSMD